MKILLAVDGSKPALNAAKYAVKLLQRMADETHHVTLISVHDDTALHHATVFVGKATVDDYLRELSEKDLKPARKLLDTAVIPHAMVLRTGHVAQEILACANSSKFDLLVLGTKGRGAVADLLMGSVAQRVLATAKQPVLLVK
jgi:nucleotide-binding universal stress UspA family protein